MAEKEEEEEEEEQGQQEEVKKLVCTYLGLTFSVSLALLPRKALSLVPALETRARDLSWRLLQAEEQLRQMKFRRKEDSKANARVVEIFASHRNAWQAEERRMLQRIQELGERMVELEKREADYKARVEELEREVAERDEMISFISRTARGARHEFGEDEEESSGDANVVYGGAGVDSHQQHNNGFDSELVASSASKFWAERASLCQDVQYESLESLYHRKHFVPRESPWKLDGEATGVSSKLKLLEQELLNLVKVGKSEESKLPSLMRKQAKRYQALAGKIDDLCRRMQASDPCEPTVSPEFRMQRQTEFLLEGLRLQQRASETGQKLMALQSEVGKSYYGEELGSQAKLTTRRSLDSIRNNLKEIQRNLEIWLARIIGDLEGIVARDGASRVREYYISRYPFVQ
ncbi:uncharacterized protein LOC133854698 isoform X2 [Alnus glutinosa]|uniref:uncharacterized protein LOC133854698 isoform X2 n=1 Tax=Alnus glutinosa TaxID=3517 RepID=UPI002D790EE4|nr:uncharacterized protein LOC133854698 isoform X2 [Alnus glutinosa]